MPLRSHKSDKTVEIMVYLIFLLVNGRILEAQKHTDPIRIRNNGIYVSHYEAFMAVGSRLDCHRLLILF